METYAKQLHTWSDILEDYPEYMKYQDLMESLKTNKDVKGLPRYVGEHVLPTLDKKTDQTIAKFLIYCLSNMEEPRQRRLKRSWKTG